MPFPKAATIDLEDWYQGIEQPFDSWSRFQKRIDIGTDRVLSILDETDTKATFFVLGWLSEKHPALIRRIADAGHEIASHGYDHEKLYDTTSEKLRLCLERAKKATEDAIGQSVKGHRAPYLTLTLKSLWAIDILVDLGFTFDSSVYPGSNWRYGIPGSPDNLYLLGNTDIVEFPASTFEIFGGHKAGVGGAYFRILPLYFTQKGIRQRDRDEKITVIYLHPWEFDPWHPIVRFHWKAMLTHYFNLWSTAPRFRSLLKNENFTTMSAVIEAVQKQRTLSRVDLSEYAKNE